MLGLVAYDSDEDEDTHIEDSKPQAIAAAPARSVKTGVPPRSEDKQPSLVKDLKHTITTLPVARSPEGSGRGPSEYHPISGDTKPTNTRDDGTTAAGEVFGPSMGPQPPHTAELAEDVDGNQNQGEEDDDEEIEEDPVLAQMSPYSRNRALCRSYTMPTLTSDFSIPKSPEVSPPPDTAQRFAHFLKLKEKNVHFNSKLAQSTGLRNPNFLDKLMEYVQLDNSGDGAGQYSSNWRKDVWDPTPGVLGAGIPTQKGESFMQALGRLQKEGFEKRQQKERTAVEFVGSTASPAASAAVPGSAAAAPAEASSSKQSYSSSRQESSSNSHRSAAERVMAGLDRDSSRNNSAKNSPSRDSSKRRDGGGGGGVGSRKKDDRDNRDRRRRSRSRSRSRDRARYRERDYGRR